MFRLPDPEQFNFKDCVIAGDDCVLVTPKDMGVEWNDENKFFRSSIWRKSDMYPVSLGFRKFTNYGEKPEFEPLPANDKLEIVTKLDGSCLIVSRYKGELIVRTRGTVDASQLENGYEIELLKKKYPTVFNNAFIESERFTFLFEWTTPTNRIVLQETQEPTLWLIGMVYHADYSYVSQKTLDRLAKEIGVERPKTFPVYDDGNVEELKKVIEPLKDIEGVVVYTGNGQILKKIKTLRYLYLHRMFTGVKTVDHLFDVWKESGYLFYYDFKEYLADTYDHELVVSLNDLINELFVIRDNISVLAKGIHEFVNQNGFKELPRKEQAQQILKTWGDWSSLAFNLLDKDNFCWEKTYKMYRNKYKNIDYTEALDLDIEKEIFGDSTI